MTADRTTVSLRIEADVDLAISDIWPDGDAPDPITAADVVALIEREGNVDGFLRQWNLSHDLDVSVTVVRPNPHHGQPPMFGEDTSDEPWIHEHAAAFDRRPQSAPVRSVVDTEAL